MEKNFNIGDRVRIVADMERPYYMWVEKGDTGVIVEGKAANGFECVKFDGCANMTYVCVESKYLKADATYAPKTAFLSELKGLLEKYDAEISAYAVGYDGELDITFNIGNVEILYSENNPIFKGHSVHSITADNIMDYDKE